MHERDRFSDFLMISLRELLNKNRNLKVILMSATLNGTLLNRFTNYFKDSYCGDCPLLSSK